MKFVQKNSVRKTKQRFDTLELAECAHLPDPIHANPKALAAAVHKLPLESRLRFLKELDRRLKGGRRHFLNDRVAAARLMVALLPTSQSTIESWLDSAHDRWCYELHFSLFCYLSDSQLLRLPGSVSTAIRHALTAYLLRVKKSTAKAAWMPGDSLGEHWEERSALIDLIRVASMGKYVAGRRASVYGLERRFEHSSKRDQTLSLTHSIVLPTRIAVLGFGVTRCG